MRGYPFSPFGFKTGELVILGRYSAAAVRFIPGGHVLLLHGYPQTLGKMEHRDLLFTQLLLIHVKPQQQHEHRQQQFLLFHACEGEVGSKDYALHTSTR